jgi:fatty-acyl-CoA synthase
MRIRGGIAAVVMMALAVTVIPRPGQELALDEVVAYRKDGVATYKLPETIEVFDELPFTPTGKIQRHVLVRRVLERRER